MLATVTPPVLVLIFWIMYLAFVLFLHARACAQDRCLPAHGARLSTRVSKHMSASMNGADEGRRSSWATLYNLRPTGSVKCGRGPEAQSSPWLRECQLAGVEPLLQSSPAARKPDSSSSSSGDHKPDSRRCPSGLLRRERTDAPFLTKYN